MRRAAQVPPTPTRIGRVGFLGRMPSGMIARPREGDALVIPFLKKRTRPEPRPEPTPEPFRPEKLKELAEFQGYRTAEPYPHLVIDDFFEPAALDRIVAEWPGVIPADFQQFNDGTFVERKAGSSSKSKFGPYTRMFLHRLGEPDFLEALEKVTGIEGILPDPYLHGGGIHQTGTGGRLAVHADFNRHVKLALDRRINILLYLNRNWTEANGGWLELWDKDMQTCVQRVLPVFNRMAIFSTTDTSFHGQPEKIAGPPDLLRRSVALYYYTVGRPDAEISDPHCTLYRERAGKGF
jgi:hypothetical protein